MAATKQRASRWYSDRDALKVFLSVDSSVGTTKDDLLDKMIARASFAIERDTGRIFIPWTGTKEFDYQTSWELILGEDLLSVTTLTYNDGAMEIDATNYFLYPLNAADLGKPYTSIEILTTDDFISYNDTKQSAIWIAGKWGYCELVRTAVTTLGAAITDTAATSITVADGTLVSIGQTLKVESEQMWISNISTNTLTVTRGVNGTTAATHVNGTVVGVIEAPADIQMACEILATRWMHRAESAWSDRLGYGAASLNFSKEIPAEVKGILNRYRRLVGTLYAQNC